LGDLGALRLRLGHYRNFAPLVDPKGSELSQRFQSAKITEQARG